MEIIVDVARSPQEQLTGTARPAGRGVKRRDFHGVVELLACLERIIDVDASMLADATTTKGDPTVTDLIEFSSLPQADQDAITTTLLSLGRLPIS